MDHARLLQFLCPQRSLHLGDHTGIVSWYVMLFPGINYLLRPASRVPSSSLKFRNSLPDYPKRSEEMSGIAVNDS